MQLEGCAWGKPSSVPGSTHSLPRAGAPGFPGWALSGQEDPTVPLEACTHPFIFGHSTYLENIIIVSIPKDQLKWILIETKWRLLIFLEVSENISGLQNNFNVYCSPLQYE